MHLRQKNCTLFAFMIRKDTKKWDICLMLFLFSCETIMFQCMHCLGLLKKDGEFIARQTRIIHLYIFKGASGWNNFPYAFEGVSFCSRMVCVGMRKRRQNLPKRKLTALGKCRLKATVRLSANDVLFVYSLFCNCALVAAQFFGSILAFILLSCFPISSA